MYGLTREEAEHVLDLFPVVCKYDERDYGEYRTKRLVLEAYDRMAAAIANGVKTGGPWLTCRRDPVRATKRRERLIRATAPPLATAFDDASDDKLSDKTYDHLTWPYVRLPT